MYVEHTSMKNVRISSGAFDHNPCASDMSEIKLLVVLSATIHTYMSTQVLSTKHLSLYMPIIYSMDDTDKPQKDWSVQW